MACFLSVCLSAWHIYTPCVTINLLYYTHIHTHTSSRSLALQHAKWKSTLRMIWISIWISDQTSAVTNDQTSKTLILRFHIKTKRHFNPTELFTAAHWPLFMIFAEAALSSQGRLNFKWQRNLQNFSWTLKNCNKIWSHRTLPAAPAS